MKKMLMNPEFLSDGGFRYEYLGNSYRNLTKWKYYVLRNFLAQEKFNKNFKNKKKIEIIKKLKDSFHGPALIVANGPSLTRISEGVIQDFSDKKSMFTVNNFFDIKFNQRIIPNYHFICDNDYWNNSDPIKVNYREKLKRLQFENDLVIIQPDYQEEFTGKNTLFIRKNPLTGFGKSINITKVNGLPNLTSFFAISTAIYLGYSPIYVVGLDLNYYKFVEYRNDIGWVLRSHHANDFKLESYAPWRYRETLLIVLNSNMMQIHYLSLFKNYDVIIANDAILSKEIQHISIENFNSLLK
jgi:hypothetical protein